jgi:hypothetical protein
VTAAAVQAIALVITAADVVLKWLSRMSVWIRKRREKVREEKHVDPVRGSALPLVVGITALAAALIIAQALRRGGE